MAVKISPPPFTTPMNAEKGFSNAWIAWLNKLFELVTADINIGASASADAAAASASANAASVSAASAAADAATVTAQIALTGAQAYSPDYIESTVNVPVKRQLIAFQRVTIAAGGSLQIYGRGRIL
jgi:hypothetical protein